LLADYLPLHDHPTSRDRSRLGHHCIAQRELPEVAKVPVAVCRDDGVAFGSRQRSARVMAGSAVHRLIVDSLENDLVQPDLADLQASDWGAIADRDRWPRSDCRDRTIKGVAGALRVPFTA